MSNDDEVKLAEIFRTGRRALIGSAYRIVGCADIAEELVQDGYLRVSKAAAAREVDNLEAFLYRTIRNLALDYVRSEKVRKRIMSDGVSDDAMSVVPSTEASPETVSVDQRNVRILDDVLAGLPQRAQQAFILARLEGLGHDEIAARLGVSSSTVFNDIKMALTACKKALDRGEA